MNELGEINNQFIKKYRYYENDIHNFFDYLSKKYNTSIDNSNILLIIRGIDTDEIKHSLQYLVEEGRYKSEETAKKYVNAIGCYFDFLKSNSAIKKCNLYDELEKNARREESYIARMMYYIEQCNELEPKKPLNIMDEDMVKMLLEWCNKQLESDEYWNDERGYKRACAALCIKMMLLYGITYRRARNLKCHQIYIQDNEIELGGFCLRFPAYLGRQMERFMKYKEKNSIYNDEGYLFTDRNGKAWTGNTSSSGIPNYLQSQFGITDLTGIIKYGISQLLLAGVNDHIVKVLTGASEDLISGCIPKTEHTNREINNKLVTVNLYYKF